MLVWEASVEESNSKDCRRFCSNTLQSKTCLKIWNARFSDPGRWSCASSAIGWRLCWCHSFTGILKSLLSVTLSCVCMNSLIWHRKYVLFGCFCARTCQEHVQATFHPEGEGNNTEEIINYILLKEKFSIFKKSIFHSNFHLYNSLYKSFVFIPKK